MDFLNVVEIVAALAGFAVSGLLCVFPRFGPASWTVVLMLVPAFLAAAVQGIAPVLQWTPQDAVFLTVACLILCVAGGCFASYSLERVNFRSDLRKHLGFFIAICAAAPILVICLYLFRPVAPEPSVDLVALGPGGYAGAVYLLLVSVVILANIEQTIRSAEEHIRWEIKFLLLGIASIFAAVIYSASQVLLYPPEYSIVPLQVLGVFPVIFLLASLLILQSWRRCTGRGRVVVSHGIVYSTITLFSVGVYLVGTSVFAGWLSEWTGSNAPVEPIVFILSAIGLTTALLATAFRNRARRWIRRNFFVGDYDYRQLWMDATEKVRSIDSLSATATALTQLIHDALGSIDFTLWLHTREPQVLRLVLARGTISGAFNEETLAFADIPSDLTEPIAVAELKPESINRWPPDFLNRAKASLVVPLISSGRFVGLLTIGSDRSGRTFDREAREFLRVLAVHAASEFHKSELLEGLVQAREAEAFRTFSTFLLHDLKNVASTLSLIAKNAVRHHGNPDFQLDAFQSIVDTAEKMKRLCNGLRTFSTSLAANKSLNDMNDIVHELAREFDISVSQRLKLSLSSLPKTDIDRQEFLRVLQNLVLNAYEACPNGPIELSTRLESAGVAVWVRDYGKGIPKEFLENELFQPFRTTKGDGLGIGLFQCKKIVEAHDGKIDVESTEGEGTVVRIVIPLSKSEKSSTEALRSNVAAADFSGEEHLRHVYDKELTP
jgi:putative PEP-CTERM system histidine kinase